MTDPERPLDDPGTPDESGSPDELPVQDESKTMIDAGVADAAGGPDEPVAPDEPANINETDLSSEQPTTALPTVPVAPPPPPGGEPPLPPAGGEPPEPPNGEQTQQWVIGGIIAFVLVFALIVFLFVVNNDDDDDDDVAEATATTAVPTAIAEAPTATNTAEPESPTEAPVEPTATTEPTAEPTATKTPEPTETPTPEATATKTPEPTKTPTPEKPTPTPEPPTPTPKPEPTPTEVPSAPQPDEGSLAYTADWTQWDLGDGWSADGSKLVSDGSEAGPIVAPFTPTTANYAVEARMAVVGSNSCAEVAGVLARAAGADDADPGSFDGYTGVVCAHVWRIDAIADGTIRTLANASRTLDTQPHTYRLEVAGDRLRFFIDGKFAGEATDSQISATGKAGLFVSGGSVVTVDLFRIYALSGE